MAVMTDDIIRKSATGETGNPGEFGTHARTEAPDDLLTTRPRRPSVHLEPGDSTDLDHDSLGFDHLSGLTVTRSIEGDGYTVSTTVPLPLRYSPN